MKYRAYKQDNDIIVKCNQCDTEHKFSFYTFGRYFLENEPFVSLKDQFCEDDQFELDGDTLSPIWVCRNFRCTNQAVVRIKNDPQPPEEMCA